MFSKIFGFKGVFNRTEYLIWGVVVPLVLFGVMAIFPPVGLLAFYLMLVSAIKRGRETATNTTLLVFLWFFLTPITMAYLLFAPKKGESLGLGGIVGIILIIIVFLGIGAVLLPQLAKHKQEIQSTTPQTTINK